MLLRKDQYPIAIVAGLATLIYLFVFLSRQNYEFIIYIGVIIFFYLLILFTNKKVQYPNWVLWGLTVWAILHMSGGGVYLGELRLYELILIPISESYEILKYDQFVHIVGFAVATFVVWVLLKPHLKTPINYWVSISIVVIMAGLGMGALNEIIEFLATVITPETGVGGYNNTSLDLVADLIGAIAAMAVIKKMEAKH